MDVVPDEQPRVVTAGPARNLCPPPPSAWRLLRVWLSLGLQSFGGGAATLYLLRRAVVERQQWMSDDDFTRSWAVCQIAPGINLLGMTILVGWRLRRTAGVALALGGLLLPSVAVTVLMTALYTHIQSLPEVHAAVRGIIPATVGLGLLLAIQMAQPPMRDSRREGRASLAISIGLLLGSLALVALTHVSVVWVIWIAGGLGALTHLRARPRRTGARG